MDFNKDISGNGGLLAPLPLMRGLAMWRDGWFACATSFLCNPIYNFQDKCEVKILNEKRLLNTKSITVYGVVHFFPYLP